MSRSPTPQPQSTARPAAALRAPAAIATFLACLVLAAAVAPAQSLPELLPDDVVAAVGASDLAAEQERLQPFLDEAERLGLLESVGGAVPAGAGADALDDADLPDVSDVPDAFADLGFLDLAGQEVWIAVSASAFRPIPALSVILRPSPAATDAFRTAIADAEGDAGVERLEEAGRTFWTYVPPEGADGLDVPVAYAQADEGVLVASTDPEIVRFVLRGLSGSDEATLADTDTYAALRGLGEGTTFGLLDAAPLIRSLEPLAAGFEAGPLLQRIHDALVTAGPSVGLIRATDEGIESRGLQLPRADGPDPALHTLLSEGTAADESVLAFVPEDAVSVTATTVDVRGWWGWLDDVLASAASLGLPSASEMVGMFGIDPQAVLLDWTGTRLVQIGTAPSDPPESGLPQEGFASDGVLLIEARDEQAAREGLGRLLAAVGPNAAAFTSPSGGAMAMPETVQVAGQDVHRLRLGESLVLDAAVVDGFALLSMSPEATEAVLSARAADDAPPAAFAEAASSLPLPARAWSVSDVRGAVLGTSEALVGQLQLMAGLGGAGGLDFDAVDEASGDVTAWLEFLGERLGTSRSVTTVEDGALRTEGFTRVDW